MRKSLQYITRYITENNKSTSLIKCSKCQFSAIFKIAQSLRNFKTPFNYDYKFKIINNFF